MQNGTFKFQRLARTMYLQLTVEEQAQVQEQLAALAELPPAQWPASQARKIKNDPPLYLVRIDDSLRAFVQVDGEQPPEVLDFVRRETLELFAQSSVKNGTS